MKTLKLNGLTRNLTLIAAGAFMATLVVLPFTTSADHLDDLSPEVSPVVTYILEDSNGNDAVFTLVENSGSMVLTLVEEPAINTRTFDDDDDAADD